MSKLKAAANKAAITMGAMVWFGAAPAAADQSFVCKDGSVITVAHKDLTKMKRTNACVAGYFGGLPKPTASKANTTPPKLRPTKQAKTAHRGGEHTQLMAMAHRADAVAREAAANTDYRNVRILNAKPGRPAVFKHRY